MTVFFFSDISWEGLHQRPQHLASRMAKDYRVVWIEPVVLSKKPTFKLQEVIPNLFTISLPAFPYNARQKWIKLLTYPISNLAFFRRLLLKIQLSILRKVMSDLSISDNQYIYYFQNFHYVNLVRFFKPESVAFDYIDNAFGFGPLPHHVHADWEYILSRADVVFVSSRTLQRQVERIRPHDLHLVSNGVEYNFFSGTDGLPKPYDIPTDKPIIGYVGAVYPWFDFDLVESMCRDLTGMNVVIIGRAHPDITGWIKRLRAYPNFIFLGFREYATIPSYVRLFSIGIIPFRKNELTEGVNPVKLYEYCAAGIPVIATDFSPELQSFAPYVTIVRSTEECLAVIPGAMNKKNDTNFIREIQTFASNNDWDQKTATILELLRSRIHQ
jgi:glycosyltransferase involved in cell wall biosynthesis